MALNYVYTNITITTILNLFHIDALGNTLVWKISGKQLPLLMELGNLELREMEIFSFFILYSVHFHSEGNRDLNTNEERDKNSLPSHQQDKP